MVWVILIIAVILLIIFIGGFTQQTKENNAYELISKIKSLNNEITNFILKNQYSTNLGENNTRIYKLCTELSSLVINANEIGLNWDKFTQDEMASIAASLKTYDQMTLRGFIR